ncbi:MAG: (d)CMP kinase, partial [Candidatus Omnitrophota bacterium]
YRALTLKALRLGVRLDDEQALEALARVSVIDLACEPGKPLQVFIDGEDVSGAIRSLEVTNNTFYAARTPGVRHIMVEWQRLLGARRSMVSDGRDLGTVVFPGAKYKFYLDADFDVRCRRRIDELKAKGVAVDEQALRQDVAERDHKDKTRSVGPLKPAEGAVIIDSTAMSIDAVVNVLYGYITENR